MKGLKKLLVLVLMVLLSANFSAFAEDDGWSIHAGGLMPVVKDVDDVDPFFGGGVSYITGNWRFTFDVYGSTVREDLGNLDTVYASVEGKASATDLIFLGLVDYLVINSENGFFAGVGGGFGYERLKFKVDASIEIAGQPIGYSPTYNWSEASAVLTAIVGVRFESGEIFVRGIFTPQYESVQGAVIAGAGFRF